jgi:hypothetical protein
MGANSMTEREPACVTELTWRPTDLASSRIWSRVRSRPPTTKFMSTVANRRIKGEGGSDRQCSGVTRPVLGWKEGRQVRLV